jgi:peptidyl-prolyl cis-trans isomerase A (cyclophilin A)
MKKLTAILFSLSIFCTSFSPADDGIFALVKTDKGEVTIRLEYEKAPMTVANFVGLVEGTVENTARAKGVPFYDGLNFHRVEPGALIQGGCPLGNGLGNPGYKFANEIHKDLQHNQAGVVVMANSGKNTNGSSFILRCVLLSS